MVEKDMTDSGLIWSEIIISKCKLVDWSKAAGILDDINFCGKASGSIRI